MLGVTYRPFMLNVVMLSVVSLSVVALYESFGNTYPGACSFNLCVGLTIEIIIFPLIQISP